MIHRIIKLQIFCRFSLKRRVWANWPSINNPTTSFLRVGAYRRVIGNHLLTKMMKQHTHTHKKNQLNNSFFMVPHLNFQQNHTKLLNFSHLIFFLLNSSQIFAFIFPTKNFPRNQFCYILETPSVFSGWTNVGWNPYHPTTDQGSFQGNALGPSRLAWMHLILWPFTINSSFSPIFTSWKKHKHKECSWVFLIFGWLVLKKINIQNVAGCF